MLQLLHCQDCTDQRHFYFDCPSVTIVLCLPLIIAYLTVQTVEAGDFNISGG
jgi:hypothetical protein